MWLFPVTAVHAIGHAAAEETRTSKQLGDDFTASNESARPNRASLNFRRTPEPFLDPRITASMGNGAHSVTFSASATRASCDSTGPFKYWIEPTLRQENRFGWIKYPCLPRRDSEDNAAGHIVRWPKRGCYLVWRVAYNPWQLDRC